MGSLDRYITVQDKLNQKILSMVRSNTKEIRYFKKREAVRLETLKEIEERMDILERLVNIIEKKICSRSQ